MTFNLAEKICQQHRDAAYRVALEEVHEGGSNIYTYGGLDYLSDKFATVLQQCCINQGDVIAVILPASAATVVAHFAALKLGAIVTPLPPELPLDLLECLQKELHLKAIVVSEALFDEAQSLLSVHNELESFIASDDVSRNVYGQRGRGFWRAINDTGDDFKPADTYATTPAYEFLELIEHTHITRTFSTHGLIYQALSETETARKADERNREPMPSISDWSSREVLFEELYPVWFSGGSIQTTK
jgi:acyl-coenzyme A synthetase/AMP-(fatty) acid ligase